MSIEISQIFNEKAVPRPDLDDILSEFREDVKKSPNSLKIAGYLQNFEKIR